MKNQWVRQFILASLLFGGGSLIYWFEFRYQPQQEEKKEQSQKVWNIPGGEVQFLKLSQPKQEFLFECIKPEASALAGCQTWKLKEPLSAEVDAAHVQDLLRALDQLKSTQTLSLQGRGGNALQAYALEEASRAQARRVSLQTAQGEIKLYLGATHPLSPSLFIGVEKSSDPSSWNQIQLVPQAIESQWAHDLLYWRNKRIFPEVKGLQGVNALRIGVTEFPEKSGESSQFWSLSLEAGKWFLQKGLSGVGKRFLADVSAVHSWLQLLESASFEAVQGPLSEFQKKRVRYQKRGRLQFDLLPGQSSPVKLEIDASQGVLYGVSSQFGEAFQVSKSHFAQWFPGWETLRAKSLMKSEERFSIQEIQLQWAGAFAQVVQEGKDWKWAEGKGTGKPVQSDRVLKFLEQFSKAKVEKFLSEKDKKASSGRSLRVKFSTRASSEGQPGKVLHEYHLWEAGGKWYGQDFSGFFSPEGQEIFSIERLKGEDLPQAPADWEQS